MELEETGADSVNVQDKEDGMTLPGVYPRKPRFTRRLPTAMTINFKFFIGDAVIVSYSGLQGFIIAAAVAFNESSVIYLVDVGREEGKWYPGTMLKRTLQPPAAEDQDHGDNKRDD